MLSQTHQFLRYSALAAPLSLVGLPLYVYLPSLFAASTGLSLAVIGTVLLAARVFEAAADPLLGRGVAYLHAKYDAKPQWLHIALWLTTLIMAAAVVAVLVAQTWLGVLASSAASKAALLTACVALAYLGYSALTIAHHTLGAAHIATGTPAARLYAVREGCALGGVFLGSVLPLVLTAAGLSWGTYGLITAVTLLLGVWLLRPQWGALSNQPTQASAPNDGKFNTFADPFLRRSLLTFFISSVSGSLPATLLGFYVADVLGLGAQSPAFLAVYFVAAAAGFAAWPRLAARYGTARIWAAAMAANGLIFVGAAFLSSTTPFVALWFGAVCVATGALLGAELMLPQTLIAKHLAARGAAQHAGVVFGWWTAAQKTALAIAAGAGLWALAALGYTPGSSANTGGLVLLYCGIPCVLKLLSAAIAWGIEADPAQHTTLLTPKT